MQTNLNINVTVQVICLHLHEAKISSCHSRQSLHTISGAVSSVLCMCMRLLGCKQGQGRLGFGTKTVIGCKQGHGQEEG